MFSLSILLMLYACNNDVNSTNKNSDNKENTIDNVTQTLVDNSRKIISMAAFKIFDKDNKPGLRMNSDGKCFIENKEFGIFDTTGVLKSIDGKIVAKFTGDRLVDADGNSIAIIDSIGNFSTKDGKKISWTNEGHLMKDKEDSGLKLVPCNNMTKQVASAITYLYFTIGASAAVKSKGIK